MKISIFGRQQFDELFDLYYEDLTRFVYSFINDEENAKDLVHDLFLTLWYQRAHIDPSRSVKSYLFSIARNRALNYLKHLKVVETNESGIIEAYQLTDTDLEEQEQRLVRVHERLQQLPERQRMVVQKCCIEGKMYREVAAELNISENTVKTHLMRGMRFLREGLREDLILFFILWRRCCLHRLTSL